MAAMIHERPQHRGGRRAPSQWVRHVALAAASSLLLGACASMQPLQGATSDDPLEPLNRDVLEFNLALDRGLIRPLAEAYLNIVPQFVRDRIRAVLDNLAEPRIMVNEVLQNRGDDAGFTFARFFLNTTLGVGGLFDIATDRGLPRRSGDFGQTLFAWGANEGVYLVLPFFGPSNTRDAIGLAVDLYTTPPAHLVHGNDAPRTNFAIGVVDGIDFRSRNIEALDELQKNALDFYALLKSVIRQRRAADLRDTRRAVPESEDLSDPGAPPPLP